MEIIMRTTFNSNKLDALIIFFTPIIISLIGYFLKNKSNKYSDRQLAIKSLYENTFSKIFMLIQTDIMHIRNIKNYDCKISSSEINSLKLKLNDILLASSGTFTLELAKYIFYLTPDTYKDFCIYIYDFCYSSQKELEYDFLYIPYGKTKKINMNITLAFSMFFIVVGLILSILALLEYNITTYYFFFLFMNIFLLIILKIAKIW